MIFSIKKLIFNFLVENWKETNIYLRAEKENPSENIFSRMQVLNIFKVPSRNKDEKQRYEGLLSFSIFQKKVENVYTLDTLSTEFLRRFQNISFSDPSLTIEFREIEVVEMTEGKENLALSQSIEYRVLTIPFFAEKI